MKEADKRYLAFGYDQYYPCGGMSDLIDSFDDIKDAINCVNADTSDWHEVYDRVKGVEIDIKKFGYKK